MDKEGGAGTFEMTLKNNVHDLLDFSVVLEELF